VKGIGKSVAAGGPAASVAEPVAWRFRHVPWVEWSLTDRDPSRIVAQYSQGQMEPLYASPPEGAGEVLGLLQDCWLAWRSGESPNDYPELHEAIEAALSDSAKPEEKKR
jgi:hypothetical protein